VAFQRLHLYITYTWYSGNMVH